MTGNFDALDWLVVLAYMVATMWIGIRAGFDSRTADDYFLAGRKLPWWLVGMSLVATDISGTDIIGVGGSAYRYGLAVGNFEWIGCVPAMIVAAFVFVPYFYRIRIRTIPEFFERRFDVRIRTAVAICWLVFMTCNLGVMLFASAKMLRYLLGLDFSGWEIAGWSLAGWEINAGIIVLAVLTGIYTWSGGLSAVVYTDTIQCVVMIGGCLLVLVIGLVQVGGPSELIDRLEARQTATDDVGPEERFELLLPADTKSPFPWSGILFGLTLVLSPAYWIGNQAIIQRSLGASSEFDASASYVWGAILKNLIPLIIAIPGIIALALFPDLTDGDTAFPALVSRLLPTGVRGLFMAAFLAALMSSVDSYLNSATTIYANDFHLRFLNPQMEEIAIVALGRRTTMILSIWAIGFGMWCATLEGSSIYGLFQTLMSFFQGPALAVLLTAVLSRRANGTGAIVGFLGGITCAVLLFSLNQEAVYSRLGWPPLFQIREPYLYYSFWSFVTAVTTILIASRFTPGPSTDKVSEFMLFRSRGLGK